VERREKWSGCPRKPSPNRGLLEGLTGLLEPHGKGILERVVKAMFIRMQRLDRHFSLLHVADLINTEVDSSNCLAYASVVNMKVGGTLGDERTITVHSSPAVVKSAPAAAPSARTRVPVGLLALAGDLHQNVLAYLKPNWVQGGEGEREGGSKRVGSWSLWHHTFCYSPCFLPPFFHFTTAFRLLFPLSLLTLFLYSH
jgi:hypothetical protein